MSTKKHLDGKIFSFFYIAMGAPERDIINEILLTLPDNVRMFRSNSGMGWSGKAARKGDITVIKNARPLHGMPEGWPDLTGWETVEITPDMVGQKIARFTGYEVKATGKLSPAQERFRDLIERMGGVYRVITPS